MRWSYKTVHYELKKEGLLGSAFLDESEVEQSLNEYGKGGWELVSILETMDGLIGVLKQPLSLDTESFYPLQRPEAENRPMQVAEAEEEIVETPLEEVSEEAVVTDYYEVVEEEIEESPETPKEPIDVGTIRIE
jgi:hypothetical protein